MSLTEDEFARISNLLEEISTEFGTSEAGSDKGLIPIFFLIDEIIDRYGETQDTFHSSCLHVKEVLEFLINEDQPFTEETIGILGDFIVWAKSSLQSIKSGQTVDSLHGNEQETEPENEKTETELSEEEELAKNVDIPLKIDLVEDYDILEEFHQEGLENIEKINESLGELVVEPKHPEHLHQVYRSFHTIKGIAGFLSLVPIQTLCYDFQQLSEKAREGEILLTPNRIDLISEANAALSKFMVQIGEILKTNEMPKDAVVVSSIILRARNAAN